MWENNLIEACSCEWSSPCVLIPEPDGTHQFCTNFRQVNKATKSDSYLKPQVDDFVDRIQNAKFVSKAHL